MVSIMHIQWNRYRIFKNENGDWDVEPDSPSMRDLVHSIARSAEETPSLGYWPDNRTREFFELVEHLPGASVEDEPPPIDYSDAPKDRVY